MHATFQLKPDELNESFLQVLKQQFKNITVEIAVSDIPDSQLAQSQPRKAGALNGRIKMSDEFNAPLTDFDEYQVNPSRIAWDLFLHTEFVGYSAAKFQRAP